MKNRNSADFTGCLVTVLLALWFAIVLLTLWLVVMWVLCKF